MSQAPKRTLVLGVANPLGVAVVRRLAGEEKTEIVMADVAEHIGFLKSFALELGHGGPQISVAAFDPTRRLLDLDEIMVERLCEGTSSIFLLGLLRDRTLKASRIRNHNMALLQGALDLCHRAKKIAPLVVATDVGLIGDYPGRFYENWLDVGQEPFDAVDRSSFEIEAACLKEKSLPIVRARIGLLSDLMNPVSPKGPWKSAANTLLPSLGFLRFLPRFITIPAAISNDCLAPITPTEWAAGAVIELSYNPNAYGKAFHLVLEDAVPMNRVLESIGKLAGGATIKGGLNIKIVDVLGAIPGLRETARRQADRVASFWAPHRYCLSRNELDTNHSKELIKSPLTDFPATKSIQSLFNLI